MRFGLPGLGLIRIFFKDREEEVREEDVAYFAITDKDVNPTGKTYFLP